MALQQLMLQKNQQNLITPTPSPSVGASATPTPTPTITVSPSVTMTPTPTVTSTMTVTPTMSPPAVYNTGFMGATTVTAADPTFPLTPTSGLSALDGNYASVSFSAAYDLSVTTISIPGLSSALVSGSASTVVGIIMNVTIRRTGTATQGPVDFRFDWDVDTSSGTGGGSYKSSIPSTLTTLTLGSASNFLGFNTTHADLSTFRGLILTLEQSNTGTTTFDIDYIEVKVYYTT